MRPKAGRWLFLTSTMPSCARHPTHWPDHTSRHMQIASMTGVTSLYITCLAGLEYRYAPVLVPAGYRLALTVRGKDYIWPGAKAQDEQFTLSNFAKPLTGCGPFLHDDPRDRPPEIFAGRTTLHFDAGKAPFLLLPVVPPN